MKSLNGKVASLGEMKDYNKEVQGDFNDKNPSGFKTLSKPKVVGQPTKPLQNTGILDGEINRERPKQTLNKPTTPMRPQTTFTKQAPNQPLTKSYQEPIEEKVIKPLQQNIVKKSYAEHIKTNDKSEYSSSFDSSQMKSDVDKNKPLRDIEEKSNLSDKLSVSDFYCQHFELIKEIIDNVLTQKFGSKVAAAIDNMEIRKKIEVDSADDVRDYLIMKKIDGLDFTIMNQYLDIIYAQAMGYGILEFLLNDKKVDEIMVCEHNQIYAEINGIPELTDYKFPHFEAAVGIAKRVVRPLNKTLDVSNPNVDGQLSNGSRISASIPPLRAEGEISITIRKFSETVEPLINYATKYQSSTPEMVKFIESEVAGKKTTIVSGGTGSGKTTLLNSMSFSLNKNERVIVIEDTREIKIQQPHVEYYLKVPSTNEGFKGIEISDIIQMALRKRPDRIIVGECRGPEMNEFLNAANTGHEGSVTSVHANTPETLFSRMENMLSKNEETKNMTHEAIMRVLSASVDIIIQTNRLEDGTRKITNITEVLGYGEEGFSKLKKMNLAKPSEEVDFNKVYMRDIFYFKITGTEEVEKEGKARLKVHGQFLATGYVPFCNRELKRKGVGFDNKFFDKRVLLEV